MAVRNTKTWLENDFEPSLEEMKKRCRRVCSVSAARNGASYPRVSLKELQR